MSNPKRALTIKVGIKRNYGKHEIYYEASELVELSSGHERQDAFNNLYAQLDSQIRHYEEVFLPLVKLPNVSETHNDGGENGTDTFTLEKITVENYQGKRRVKAVGGKYAKWGVAVYDGVVTDLDLDALAYGEHHQFAALKLQVVAELEGGKAVRVRSIS